VPARTAPFIPRGHRATVRRYDTGDDIAAHVRLIGNASYLAWSDPDIAQLADDIRHVRCYGVERGAPFIPLKIGRWEYHFHPPDPRAPGDMGKIWSFMDRNIAYIPDDDTWDTFREPKATLALGGGDCDDQASLIDALAFCMGYRDVGACVIGVDSEVPSHIYALVMIDGHRIAMDTAVPEYKHVAKPGWEFPDPKSKQDFWFRPHLVR
jgi:hypothetical protein